LTELPLDTIPDGLGLPPVASGPLLVEAVADAPQKGSHHAVIAAWASGAAILVGLVVFTLHFGDVATFLATVRAANPFWIALAIVGQSATYLCGATVWQRVLAHAGSPLPLSNLVRLTMVEFFANQVVPIGGVSGNLMVMRGLTHRGVPAPVAVTALIVAVLSYFSAYLFVGLLAFGLLWHSGDLSAAWQWLFAAFAGVVLLLGAAGLAFRLMHGRIIPAFLRRWAPFPRLTSMLGQARFDLLRDGRLVAEAIGLQLAIFLLDAAALWCVCRGVGFDMGASKAFMCFVLASLVATLTPIPLGLGTFEGTSVGLLHLSGMSLEAALAATLLLRGLTLWLPLLPGLVVIRRETRLTRSVPHGAAAGTVGRADKR
jgi:uncharacterized membrane protein YbhN (UPF0104 family)